MISMIWAMAEYNAIGYENKLPLNLKSDLAYFKHITTGHPVIMGRKTFESIGKPLPNRENIILTHDKNYKPENCVVFNNLFDILTYVEDKDVFIIGGASLYEEFMPVADKLYITKIDEVVEADTFFPEINYADFTLVYTAPCKENEHKFTWLIFERKR